MKRRLLVLGLILVAALAVSPGGVGGSKAQAVIGAAEYDLIVHYDCIVGPQLADDVVGEWHVDCAGNMTGWGWEPGHGCTYTERVFTGYCYREAP